MSGQIVLVTGIMAAGKSTVAQALADRFPRSVHLRGDVFRRMIVNGRAEMTPGASGEAEGQLELRYRLATNAARTYASAGFAVIYQDVILGPALEHVVEALKRDGQPVFVVVLAPAADVAERRDREREKTAYGTWTAHQLDAGLRAGTPRIGLWLDTSDLSVTETVEAILAGMAEARVGKAC